MLNKHFQEFLKYLDARGARYVIVGGYAVGRHGHPRYTNDLDILVEPGLENATKVAEAFADFGFPNTVTPEYFVEPDQAYAIGSEPIRIHLLTGIPGVTFDDCVRQQIYIDEGGHRFPVIGFDALIRNKQATGRPIDLQDVVQLERLRDRSRGREQDR